MGKIGILSPKHTRYNWSGIKKNLKEAELKLILRGIFGEKELFFWIHGSYDTISNLNFLRIRLRYWLVGWNVSLKFWNDMLEDENGDLRTECLEIRLRRRY